MKNLIYIVTILTTLFIFSCEPDPTCSDGLRNGNETGVDCGGPCLACPSCNDGIQNGSELGIDCGGNCIPCYSIGDTGPGGGVIFYDRGNNDMDWRYLEASPSDQAEEAQWGCEGTFIGNTLGALGSGKLNTDLVTNKCFPTFVFSSDPQFRAAFYYCTRLSLNGQGDWFLPSREELRLMYDNKALIGEFRDGPYWSSTEERDDDSWLKEFSNGDEYCDFKSKLRRIRAIRRF